MPGVNGVHHITAIAGPAQENLHFYAGVLGKPALAFPNPHGLNLALAEAAPGRPFTAWGRQPGPS